MNDKILHFLVGGLIALVSYPFIGVWCMAPVSVAAIGKEVYDLFHRDKHTPELLDALATIVGGVITTIGWRML